MDDMGSEVVLRKNCIYRPLKTQAEIEREEAIEKMAEILDMDLSILPNVNWLGLLYDTGYRMVGKKISSEDFKGNFDFNHMPLIMFANGFDIFRKVQS